MALPTNNPYSLPAGLVEAMKDVPSIWFPDIEALPRRSAISAVATVHFAKQVAFDAWQHATDAYGVPTFVVAQPRKVKRPKWGQPGRGRRRTERKAARAAERTRNEVQRLMQRVDLKLAAPNPFKDWQAWIDREMRAVLGAAQNDAADAMAYAVQKATP